jgi:hypothetical protein
MAKHCYRIAYERLSQALRQAEQQDAEALDRATAELDAFIAAMIVDPRKLRAIAADSPACAQEILARAEQIDLPRAVLDPVHDVAFARLWLATLDDRQVRMLQGALADELHRRTPPPPALRGPYRRLPPAGAY